MYNWGNDILPETHSALFARFPVVVLSYQNDNISMHHESIQIAYQ